MKKKTLTLACCAILGLTAGRGAFAADCERLNPDGTPKQSPNCLAYAGESITAEEGF